VDIAIVGLGRIGTALARALLANDVVVHGYDIDSTARSRATDAGVVVHSDLDTLATSSSTIITSLPSVAAVRQVVAALAAVVRPGTLILETSTCGPPLVVELGELLGPAGARLVDAPVSGKPPAMAMLIGGAPGVLGDAEAPLTAVVRDLVHLGRPGAGYTAKLLQQYVKYARFLVAAEAITFAEAEGMDVPETVRALLAGTGAVAGLATAEEYFAGDRVAIDHHAPLSTITKDVELARTMFADAGFASPSFAALAEFFLDAGAAELSDQPYPDIAALLPTYRFPEGVARVRQS
jgi:3-hydroxyisobutyrate dehydrogenase-like beta-hydroxyacid dehydrogenase